MAGMTNTPRELDERSPNLLYERIVGQVRELISSQRAMEFRVSDTARAAEIIGSGTIDGDRVIVPIEES